MTRTRETRNATFFQATELKSVADTVPGTGFETVVSIDKYTLCLGALERPVQLQDSPSQGTTMFASPADLHSHAGGCELHVGRSSSALCFSLRRLTPLVDGDPASAAAVAARIVAQSLLAACPTRLTKPWQVRGGGAT